MKKALTIVLLLFISNYTLSQVKFGITADFVYSSLSEPDKNPLSFNGGGYEYKFGFEAGVFLELGFSDKVSGITELKYSSRGAKVTSVNFPDAKDKLDFISLPLLAKYNISSQVNLLLGPEVGYLISQGPAEIYDNFDYGIKSGVGLNVNDDLSLELKYYHGLKHLSSVFFTEDGISGYDIDFAQNRVFSIGIRYYLL